MTTYYLQVVLVADCLLKELESDLLFDAVVLPGGGKGAENLAASQEVGAILKRHEKQGKILAAVCAAPTAFLSHDIGKGKNITSYPAFKAWIILQLNLCGYSENVTNFWSQIFQKISYF